MKRIVIIIMAAVLVALPTMAQTFGEQEPQNAVFQSTSTMQGSGSAYSSQPTLDENGTAYSPAAAPAGRVVRKSTAVPPKPKPDENDPGNVPIGDAVLPLMLMALAFGGYIAIKRRRQTAKN